MSAAEGRCLVCAHADERGWWGRDDVTHHRRCHRTWRRRSREAHCHSCCAHFASVSAFDRHQRMGQDGKFECLDPATLVTKGGDPVLVLKETYYGPVWARPTFDAGFVKELR